MSVETGMALSLPECLAARTGYLLTRAARQLTDLMEQALEPHGFKPRHYSVLAVLGSVGALSQQRVSEILHIDRSTMVSVIDDLEQQGLVERQRQPTDRRAYQLLLTAAGREAEGRLRAVVDQTQAGFFGRLSGEERADLQRVLRRFLCDGSASTAPATESRQVAPASVG